MPVPTWWFKIEHSWMEPGQIIVYNCLRMERSLKRLESFRDREGKVRAEKYELCRLIREIGNCLCEIGYFDETTAVWICSRDKDLYNSIREMRHLLAHDENRFPVQRIISFYLCSSDLRENIDKLKETEIFKKLIGGITPYLPDDSPHVIEFVPKSLASSPYVPDNIDYLSISYAAILMDMEERGNPVSSAIDIMSRLSIIMKITSADKNIFPLLKMERLEKVLLDNASFEHKRTSSENFIRKQGPKILAGLRNLVKANKNAENIVREFSEWLNENRDAFLEKRDQFAIKWLEGNSLAESDILDDDKKTVKMIRGRYKGLSMPM